MSPIFELAVTFQKSMNERIDIMFAIAGLMLAVGLFGRIRKIQLSTKTSLIIKKAFIFLCFLLLMTFILSLLGIYFRGYWTTKVIIWTFVFTGSLLYSFGNRQVLTKSWRRFTATIFYSPLVLVLLLVIPTFLGTILSYALWLRLSGDPKAIYYNDNDIRIQKVCSDCEAGFQGYPRYFKKQGMFELDKGELDNGNNMFDNKIKVQKTEDSVTVYLFYTNQEPVPFKFER